jgi:ribosomal 30S subunit maturation factor RimM
MKLAAIYNCWADGLDLLPYSINNILPVVDGVIVVWSKTSNYGVENESFINFIIKNKHDAKVTFEQLEPEIGNAPHDNEIRKRQHGLDIAKRSGYTHFIMMDSDEFYEQELFDFEKDLFDNNPDLLGLVCRTKVYFKKPTLTIGFDHTLVPFIHKLTPDLKCGRFPDYPYAYDDQGHAHIDPTRRLNIKSGVGWSVNTMHHYSWVRSDYSLKIENSSASKNLKKSSIYKDLEEAKEGHYNEFYRSHLTQCDNTFNLPEL